MDSFSVSFPHFLLWKILRFHMFHFHHGFETCALLPLLLWRLLCFLVAPWDCSPNYQPFQVGAKGCTNLPRGGPSTWAVSFEEIGDLHGTTGRVSRRFFEWTQEFSQQEVTTVSIFLKRVINIDSRWWFQIFFIFIPIWGNDPIWLIFFKWVETTN